MNAGIARDFVAVVLLVGSTIAALLLAPLAAWRELHEPTTRAGMLMVATLLALLAFRRLGARAARLERLLLCVFLASMPLIYLESGLWHGAKERLLLEGLGLVLFAGWAFLAYSRDAWVLAAGIAAHGVLWDSWHHGVDYIPSWYASACLVVDLGWAGYVLLQRDRWAVGERGAQKPSPAPRKQT
jgi:hypothetical protein